MSGKRSPLSVAWLSGHEPRGQNLHASFLPAGEWRSTGARVNLNILTHQGIYAGRCYEYLVQDERQCWQSGLYHFNTLVITHRCLLHGV